jgi:hypothetical protein
MTVPAAWLSAVATAAALVIGVSGSADAGPVYDNGPLGETLSALSINKGFSISDSFTLTGATSLEEAKAVFWTLGPSHPPTGVGWSIGSAPFGQDLGTGVSTVSNTYLGQSDFQFSDGTRFDVYESTFSLRADMGAGTYYLTLANATSVSSQTVEWSVNNGPSAAFASFSGGGAVPSEFFQLFGSSAAVPEPSTLTLFGTGGLALAGAAIRRRRGVAGSYCLIQRNSES